MNILIEIFFCDSFLAEAGNRGRGGRGRRFKNRHRNGKIPKFIKNKLFPEWDGYDKHISPVPNDGRYWYFTQLTVTLPNCSNVLEECESLF